MIQKMRISLEMKAKIANGHSRACEKCNLFPCGIAMTSACSKDFIEGFKKGYATHKKETKDDKRL